MPPSIGIRLGVEGQAEIKRALGEVEAAGKAAFGGVANAAEQAGTASEKQVERYKRLAQAAREAQAADRAQANINSLLGVGAGGDGSARASAAAFEAAFASADRLPARLKDVAVANDNATRTIGLQSYAWRNLGMQANDAATMLLSGSSAFQVVATQGGQVLQVLQGAEGGVSGAFKDIAGRAGAMVNPVTAAVAALIAVGAASALAFNSYSDGQKAVEQSITGVGRASGASVAQINDVADAAASVGKISAAAPREMASTFASTGKINVRVFGDLISTSRDLGKTLGVDTAEAASFLAKALGGDLAKGAEQLNERLGFLDAKTLTLIRTLETQGNRTGATRVIMEAMSTTLVDAETRTSALGKAWDYVKGAASGAFDALGRTVSRAVNGPEVSQATLDALNRQIEQSRNSPRLRGLSGEEQDMALQQLMTQRDAVMIALDTARRTASADARDMEQRATSLAAQNIIRQFLPDQGDIEQLEKFKTTLERALEAPNAPGGLEVVLQRVKERLQAGGAEAERFGRSSRDAFALSGLTGYARELETIRQKYAELIETASRSGNLTAVGTLVMAQGADVQAVNDNLLRTPSTYRKGVADVPEQYRAALLAASARYNVDPNLGASVLWQESRFNPGARNKSGAAGIAQFMPGTAAQYGIDPMDPQQAIPAMVRMLSERLMARNGNVPLALADYNFGAGNVNRVGQDPSRFPAETRNYIAEITRQTPAVQAQVEMVRSWEKGTKDSTQALELHRGSLAMTTFEIEKSKQARQLENEAIQRGEELTDGLKAKIDAEATARARNAAAIQQTNAERFIEQQRRELGMTSTDVMVERQMRSLGVGQNDPQRAFVESNLRMNASLTETRNLAGESLKGFLSDLRSGASLMDSLGNLTSRLADRMMSMAADRAIAAMFGGIGGSGGGLMGWVSGLMGGSAVPARADGGWIFGPGGPREDRVLARLSPGEFVVNASSAARNADLLQAINDNRLPCFAAGGFVRTGSGVPAVGSSGPLVTVINNSGAAVQTREVDDGRGGRRAEVVVGEMVAQGVRSPQGQRALRDQNGLRPRIAAF